jgi:hypothetical protein
MILRQNKMFTKDQIEAQTETVKIPIDAVKIEFNNEDHPYRPYGLYVRRSDKKIFRWEEHARFKLEDIDALIKIGNKLLQDGYYTHKIIIPKPSVIIERELNVQG